LYQAFELASLFFAWSWHVYGLLAIGPIFTGTNECKMHSWTGMTFLLAVCVLNAVFLPYCLYAMNVHLRLKSIFKPKPQVTPVHTARVTRAVGRVGIDPDRHTAAEVAMRKDLDLSVVKMEVQDLDIIAAAC
jgi:hypothetical protein